MLSSVQDQFEVLRGAKQWPPGPDEVDAQPSDCFTCKHCGEVQWVQVYGAFTGDPLEQLNRILRDHLFVCRNFHKWRGVE